MMGQMTGDAAIEVEGLRKAYGDHEAVRGLTFTVARGEVYGLLGPNGAGKTTTVEILEGYRERTAGRVSVLGMDPGDRPAALRERVGIVLQSSGLYRHLTVREAVAHWAGLYPAPREVDETIALTGLEASADVRTRALSGGQQRRLDFALALIGDPELVFLDEPTTGFDPASRRAAWRVIGDLRGLGKTVLLTTHYLDEAEHLADRVGVIVGGRLIEVGTPQSLGGRSTAEAVVRFRADGPLAGARLPGFPALGVQRAEGVVAVRTTTPTAVVGVLSAWAAAAGVDELPELCVLRPTLEDVYLRLVDESTEVPV
jgi:ABC-2 type transport system ATP-binding protein